MKDRSNRYRRWSPEYLGIALILFSIGVFPVKVYAKTVSEEGRLTHVSGIISYELEGRQEPPETTVLEVRDVSTGKEYECTVSCMEIREKEVSWKDDFSFSITVTGYDSDVFLLGETEIPADAELLDYGEEFLTYLGISPDCYAVETIQWDGECYEANGVICRNAEANGKKLVRHVDVKYGGQVWIPEFSEQEDTGTEDEKIQEQETGRNKEQSEKDLLQQKEEPLKEPVPETSMIEKLKTYIREHLTVVTIGITFLVGILGSAGLLWVFRKAGKEKEKPD